MTIRKDIIRFWAVFCLLLAFALGVITMVHRWHRLFPSDEVSEYYTRYAGSEGMDVSYVKGYLVNDTLRLDVTLLEVHDSAVWEQTCTDLGLLTNKWIMENVPEEVRDMYFEPGGFESYVLYDTLVVGGKATPLQTVFLYHRLDRTICIFHHVTDAQYDAIMDNEIDKI